MFAHTHRKAHGLYPAFIGPNLRMLPFHTFRGVDYKDRANRPTRLLSDVLDHVVLRDGRLAHVADCTATRMREFAGEA